MRKTRTYEDMVTIARPKKEVMEFMSDLKNIQHLHPFMLSVQEIPVTGEELKKYKGLDRFPIFLYFSKKMSYTIDLVQQTDDYSLYKSDPGGGINLTVRYSFREGENKNQCVVVERSEMTGSIFLLPLAWKGLTSSHKQLLENVKWHLESKQ